MDLLTEFGSGTPYMPYVVVLGMLMLSGLGLPIPEDIPLILAGYLCYHGYADPWVLFPLTFLAVLGADLMIFMLGRRYGHHVPKLPLMRRFLTEKRLGKTESLLHQHGGKFMIASRFLPGLRAAAIFTAGNFKLPYWKFLLYNGGAALVSVPTILGLAYYYADKLERVRVWIANGERGAVLVIVLAAAGFIGFKLLMSRRNARKS